MATFIFKNGKSKRIHTRNVEDDVVLTLPNEPGIVFTTNTTDDAISNKNQDPDYIDSVHVKYILKPDIGNNGGIRNENANITPLRRAAYITSSNFIGPLEYTEWEAYTDESLTNLLDSTTLVLHKDSWYPNTTALGLDAYIRYRFYSGEIRSPWSDTIHFKTPMLGIEPFTVTITESLTPTIRTSGFIVDGETSLGKVNHYATTYRIYRIDTGELVYSSEDNTEDLLEHTVTKRLDKNTSYYLEVFYTADNELVGDSNTVTLTFRTPDVKIETPVVSYTSTSPVEGHYDYESDSWVGIPGHFISSSPFRSEDPNLQHTSTLWKIYATSYEGDRLVFSVETFKDLTYLNITNYLTNPEKNLRAEVRYRSNDLSSNIGAVEFAIGGFIKPGIIATPVCDTKKYNLLNYRYVYEDGENTFDAYAVFYDDTYDSTHNDKHLGINWDGNKFINKSIALGIENTGPYIVIDTGIKVDNTFNPQPYPDGIVIRVLEKTPDLDPLGRPNAVTDHLIRLNKTELQGFLHDYDNRLHFLICLKDLKVKFDSIAKPSSPRKIDLEIYLEYGRFFTNKVTIEDFVIDAFYGIWKMINTTYDGYLFRYDSTYQLYGTLPRLYITPQSTRSELLTMINNDNKLNIVVPNPTTMHTIDDKYGYDFREYWYDTVEKHLSNTEGSYFNVYLLDQDKNIISIQTYDFNKDAIHLQNDQWCMLQIDNEASCRMLFNTNYYYYVTYYHPIIGEIGFKEEPTLFTIPKIEKLDYTLTGVPHINSMTDMYADVSAKCNTTTAYDASADKSYDINNSYYWGLHWLFFTTGEIDPKASFIVERSNPSKFVDKTTMFINYNKTYNIKALGFCHITDFSNTEFNILTPIISTSFTSDTLSPGFNPLMVPDDKGSFKYENGKIRVSLPEFKSFTGQEVFDRCIITFRYNTRDPNTYNPEYGYLPYILETPVTNVPCEVILTITPDTISNYGLDGSKTYNNRVSGYVEYRSKAGYEIDIKLNGELEISDPNIPDIAED